MNLSNNDVANRELSIDELETIAAGGFWRQIETIASHWLPIGGGCYHDPHQGGPSQGGPREYPGGVPNDPALNPHLW
jgi:hypothetical protein